MISHKLATAGLLLLGVAASSTAVAEPVITQISSKRFSTDGSGLVFPFQPFNPAAGELQSVHVHGSVVMIATGIASPASSVPYPIQLFVSIDIGEQGGHGFGFIPGWELLYDEAFGPPVEVGPMPFNYINMQEFSFTIDGADNIPVEFSPPSLGNATMLPALADTSLAHFTSSSGEKSSFATLDMSVTDGVALNPLRFGGGMVVEYQYVPADLDTTDERIEDGEFKDELDAWETGGNGSVDVVDQPPGSGNKMAELTTASPVTLGQSIDIPDEPFRIEFDYAFLSTDGELTVMLGSQVLETIRSDLNEVPDFDGVGGFGTFAGFERFRLSIDDPALLALGNGTPLTFAFDGVADSQILIDNVVLAPIIAEVNPHPATGINNIERQGENLVLEWIGAGMLQEAETLQGPWEDRPDLSSPATLPLPGKQGFYRIVVE